jgi:hypothetical protein
MIRSYSPAPSSFFCPPCTHGIFLSPVPSCIHVKSRPRRSHPLLPPSASGTWSAVIYYRFAFPLFRLSSALYSFFCSPCTHGIFLSPVRSCIYVKSCPGVPIRVLRDIRGSFTFRFQRRLRC